jgi:uncharacterized membrane protein YgcG
MEVIEVAILKEILTASMDNNPYAKGLLDGLDLASAITDDEAAVDEPEAVAEPEPVAEIAAPARRTLTRR